MGSSRKRWLGVFLVSLLGVAGCSEPEDELSPELRDLKARAEEREARLEAATLEARETIDQFVARLENPSPEQRNLALKVRFEEAGKIEHLWLTDVEIDGENFSGTINNEPAEIRKVTVGQTVTVPLDRVSDWMAVENGKLVGGYTLRVMRDTMSVDRRQAFEQTVDFVFD